MNAVKFAIPHTVSWVIAMIACCEQGKVTQLSEAQNRALEHGQGNKLIFKNENSVRVIAAINR